MSGALYPQSGNNWHALPHQQPSLLQVSVPTETDDHLSLPPRPCLVAVCAVLLRYREPPPCCSYSGSRPCCNRIPSRPGILVSLVRPSLRPSNTGRLCFGPRYLVLFVLVRSKENMLMNGNTRLAEHPSRASLMGSSSTWQKSLWAMSTRRSWNAWSGSPPRKIDLAVFRAYGGIWCELSGCRLAGMPRFW